MVFDFSIATLPACLKELMQRTRIVCVPSSGEAPWWIRSAESEVARVFDDESWPIVLLAAYYLGEAFSRLPGLRWTTGDSDYMHKHMPVISGFKQNLEIAPLVVIRTVFKRIKSGRCPVSDLDNVINKWMQFVPSGSEPS